MDVIKQKVSGNTLMETIIASIILLVSFSVVMMIISNLSSAHIYLDEVATDLFQTHRHTIRSGQSTSEPMPTPTNWQVHYGKPTTAKQSPLLKSIDIEITRPPSYYQQQTILFYAPDEN